MSKPSAASHPRRLHLRLQRGEIGADAGAAGGGVRLIKRAHTLEHRDMIVQPHIDLRRYTRRTIGFFRLIIQETCSRGGERCQKNDQPDKPDQQRQQPICP